MNQERYLELLQPAIDIIVKKDEDYANELLGLHSYFPFQDKSYVQMLFVKVQRLVALVSTEQEPNYESIADTVRDLVNYCAIYLDYLEPEA